MYRIVLRVTGVDLEDDDLFERLEKIQGELTWSEVGGRTLVTVYADCVSPVGKAVEVARRITAACGEAQVVGVDPELVGISDIAQRIGVNRETVRLWADGLRGPGGFPVSLGSVGGGGARGAARVWAWGDVNGWLRRHYGLGDEVLPLDADQQAAANAELRRIQQLVDAEWEAVAVPVAPTVIRETRVVRRPVRADLPAAAEERSSTPKVIPAMSSHYSGQLTKSPK